MVPGSRASFLGLSSTQKPRGRGVAEGHPGSGTRCEAGGFCSAAGAPALPELLPSAEHAAGSWTPGTPPHVTQPRPPPPGRSPQPCSADEDKPFLVAAAAPALSHQVFNVLKLSPPWAPLSLSCRPVSLESQVLSASSLLLLPTWYSAMCFSVRRHCLNPSCLLSDAAAILWGRTNYSRGT